MRLRVGTSGFAYKEWKRTFYTEDLPASQMLHFYSEHFPTVEINQTFRVPPTAPGLAMWAREVPADFKFAIKAPQRITHIKRLKGVGVAVSSLLKTTAVLKKRLGPLLFQLPPNFKKDVPRLRAFLQLLPARTRAAFEFRHASWFDDEVFDLLRKRRAALCIAEAEGDLVVPFVATARWGYLRLRRDDYSDAELKTWLKRVRKQDWQEAFVFFKHDDEGKAPQLAKRLLALAG